MTLAILNIVIFGGFLLILGYCQGVLRKRPALRSMRPTLYRAAEPTDHSAAIAIVFLAVLGIMFAWLAFRKTSPAQAVGTTILFLGLSSPLVLLGSEAWKSWFSQALRSPWVSRYIDHPVRVVVIVYLLYGPIYLGLFPGLHLLPGLTHGLNVERLLLFGLAYMIFLVIAPLPDIGYTLQLNRRDIVAAGKGLLMFAAVIIPLGLRIGFMKYGLKPFEPFDWLWRALTLFFFVALPEELLFRGVIQNVLEQNWVWRYRRLGSLLLGSIIFGAEHLNSGHGPDYRYMLVATLAGLAYGWVWQRTRKVSASALTHTAVDWIWQTLFAG